MNRQEIFSISHETTHFRTLYAAQFTADSLASIPFSTTSFSSLQDFILLLVSMSFWGFLRLAQQVCSILSRVSLIAIGDVSVIVTINYSCHVLMLRIYLQSLPVFLASSSLSVSLSKVWVLCGITNRYVCFSAAKLNFS